MTSGPEEERTFYERPAVPRWAPSQEERVPREPSREKEKEVARR